MNKKFHFFHFKIEFFTLYFIQCLKDKHFCYGLTIKSMFLCFSIYFLFLLFGKGLHFHFKN